MSRRRSPRFPVKSATSVPVGAVTLSPAKVAALQEIQAAIGAARDAQKKGDFAAYGSALQRLDEAITQAAVDSQRDSVVPLPPWARSR